MTVRIDKPDTNADKKLHIVLDDRQPFIMKAGAGSGKTTSLVKGLDYIRRIKGSDLIQHKQRIACITYTEIATKEIFEDVGHDDLFHVSTIHSFLWEQIKPFTKEIRAWLIESLEEKITNLREHNQKPRTRDTTREKNNRKIDLYHEQVGNLDNIDKFFYQSSSDLKKGILGHSEVIKIGPALLSTKPVLRKIIARKYPFFFVDESQDTIPEFIAALIQVREDHKEFCLGFFGDQMQNIYMSGVGEIPNIPNATVIDKPENFRSPEKVLHTVNVIRKNGDGLLQISGWDFSYTGSSTIFILPQDEYRTQNLQKVQTWLSENLNDLGWHPAQTEYNVKQLVIVHRIAANRLGFSNLYIALNDGAPNSFKTRLSEGEHWTINPFLKVILPLIKAIEHKNNFEIIEILRKRSPLLNTKINKDIKNFCYGFKKSKTSSE